MGHSEEDKILFMKTEDFYDLMYQKLQSNFSLDETNFNKLNGEMTLLINNSEYYVSFGRQPSILMSEDVTKKPPEIYVELFVDKGKWMLTVDSKMNPEKYSYYPFNESVIDRTIKQFKYFSGYEDK
ncbi:hypothetical protein [Sporosarcina highlanderae]|uniref:Uncharacterized protein n=1 Tax=Sporosarcina highlanderae TaxID=3035916 RepID=A0ABT8JT87_9BACL|nr:hypothetical protein [Sporosarcina highlanderae]MDN4607364.1 hypothetical protein [Sporosarcina highlanderae]